MELYILRHLLRDENERRDNSTKTADKGATTGRSASRSFSSPNPILFRHVHGFEKTTSVPPTFLRSAPYCRAHRLPFSHPFRASRATLYLLRYPLESLTPSTNSACDNPPFSRAQTQPFASRAAYEFRVRFRLRFLVRDRRLRLLAAFSLSIPEQSSR